MDMDLEDITDARNREEAARRRLDTAIARAVDGICTSSNAGLCTKVGGDVYEIAALTWESFEQDGPDPQGAVTLVRNGAALVDVRPFYRTHRSDRLAFMPTAYDEEVEYDVPVATDGERVAFVSQIDDVIAALRKAALSESLLRTEALGEAADSLGG